MAHVWNKWLCCRATAASERNWYRVIESMYNGSSKSLSLADLERLEAAGLSFTHLFQQTSHRKEDLIVRCLFLYMYMYLLCSKKMYHVLSYLSIFSFVRLSVSVYLVTLIVTMSLTTYQKSIDTSNLAGLLTNSQNRMCPASSKWYANQLFRNYLFHMCIPEKYFTCCFFFADKIILFLFSM